MERYVITDEVRGWHGKVRDEKRRLKPVEKTGNIIDLLKRLDMDDKEYNKLNQKGETANGV